jgi:glycosyltransferase involved in cell wall biosynthesis
MQTADSNKTQSAAGIRVGVVMPCLNEEDNLARTCASLGFGIGKLSAPTGAYLFLIDNGSTDDTRAVAETIRENSPEGSVFIDVEQERGYVPPRHHGHLMVKAIAESRGWNDQDIVILQADADTCYADGYIEFMASAAEAFEAGVLIESKVGYPPDFKAAYPGYIELCRAVDDEFAALFPDNDDIIVDDKVSGYRLLDYFKWGSHQREYTSNGEEIHAETTRLYMRAKVKGGRKEIVDSAIAYHSPRKVVPDPLMHLASAGFPREGSWRTRWLHEYGNPMDLSEMLTNPGHPVVQRALKVRSQHVIALFGILPLHVDWTLRENPRPDSTEFSRILRPLLPKRTLSDLLNRPGIFLTDVFDLIDHKGDDLLDVGRKIMLSADI